MFFLSIVLCIILIDLFLAFCAGGIALLIMGINAIKYSYDWVDTFFGIAFLILAFFLFILSLLPLVPFFI